VAIAAALFIVTSNKYQNSLPRVHILETWSNALGCLFHFRAGGSADVGADDDSQNDKIVSESITYICLALSGITVGWMNELS
jgi:hypothetical protein